ncbi:MAG: hypothetical protein ACRD1L_07755, partial [Terriglobales bacterium]
RYNNEVRVRCGAGGDQVLLRRSGLVDYAILGDQLAALTVPASAWGAGEGGRAELIAHGKTVAVRSGVRAVYASCGTIVAVLDSGDAWDLVAKQPVGFTELAQPTCNSGRSTILGLDGARRVVLQPGGDVGEAFTSSAHGVSPSGSYFVFVTAQGVVELCIGSLPGAKRTYYRISDSLTGTLSIDNAGRVLFEDESGGGCYYGGPWSRDFSKARTHAADACYGVFLASPSSAPKLVVPTGFKPTWVPQSAVAELLAAARERPR